MFKMYTHCCCRFLVAFFSLNFIVGLWICLFIETLLLYLQKCSMYFSAQLLLLDMIFLTLSQKPGKNLLIVLSFVYIFYDLSLSTRLTKLLRFKLNQITIKRSGRTRLEVADFYQAYQETLVKPGLPCFWGRGF